MSDAPPSSVLFACNLNSIRSPMAAALMRLRAGSRSYAASCGVWRGAALDPFMVQVMREKGLDLSDHTPTMLEDLGDASFDLIVALTEESHARAQEFARTRAIDVEFWPVADPSRDGGARDSRLQAYRDVRDAIDTLIRQRFFGRSTSEG